MYANNARTHIEIDADADGNFTGIDKIVVGQAAVLGGTLFVYTPADDRPGKAKFKPALGARYNFLSTTDGINGDFAVKNLNSAGPFQVGTAPPRFLTPDKKPTEYDLLVVQAGGGQQPP